MQAPTATATRPFPTPLFGGPQKPPHIVVAGNGIGGMAVVSQLKQGIKKHPGLAHVTLIGPRPDFIFKPLLLDTLLAPRPAASQPIAPKHTQPNDPIQFRQGSLTDFSLPPHGQVRYGKGESLGYDYLVMALGCVPPSNSPIPGLQAHALPLETPEDITRLQASVEQKLTRALANPTEAKNLSFVILGGGVTGVEAALLLHARVSRELKARRADPALQPRITLIHGGKALLSDPYFSPLKPVIQDQLTKAGIQVLLRHWVVGVEAHQVIVKDSATGALHTLDTQQPINALGGVPHPLARQLTEATQQRVSVNPFLELPSQPNVYVIGDLAEANDTQGRPLPMLGQVADQQGRYVGQDLYLKLLGKSQQRRPFRYKHHGVTLPLTGEKAVMEIKLPGGKSLLLRGRLAAWLRQIRYRTPMRRAES